MLTRHFRKPASFLSLAVLAACGGGDHHRPPPDSDDKLAAIGKQVFRFDTFGDEAKWTDTLRIHEAIAASVVPATALGGGRARPAAVQRQGPVRQLP